MTQKIETQSSNPVLAWQHVTSTPSLHFYFVSRLMRENTSLPVEGNLFADAVAAEVDLNYGQYSNRGYNRIRIVQNKGESNLAKEVRNQLIAEPFVEMGNLPDKSDISNATLVATTLMKRVGLRYHIGLCQVKSGESIQKASALINESLCHVEWGMSLLERMDFMALDAQQVGRRFFAACLKHPDSVWHGLMKDRILQCHFAQALGMKSLFETPNGYPVLPQSIEKTITLLDAGQIVPSQRFLQAGLYAAQIKLAGNVQQSNESIMIKQKMARFFALLSTHPDMKRFARIGILTEAARPDMCFDGLAGFKNENGLMTLGQIHSLSLKESVPLLKKLPALSGSKAVENGVEFLRLPRWVDRSNPRKRSTSKEGMVRSL